MGEIPGLGTLKSKEIVNEFEDDYKLEITTYAFLQDHEANYLVSLGWSTPDNKTFTYYKPNWVEPDLEDFKDLE